MLTFAAHVELMNKLNCMFFRANTSVLVFLGLEKLHRNL